MPIALEKRPPLTQPQGVEAGYAQTALRWPSRAFQKRPLTTSELAGPARVLERLGARAAASADLAGHAEKRALGQLIHVRAAIVDEDGGPVGGAAVEVWHCNAAGRYLHPNDTTTSPADPNFNGAARLAADAHGRIELRTIKPAAYPVPDSGRWWRPPHIHFSVWGRAWLSRLVTQMFFPGEPLNERDAILNAVRDPAARSACIATLLPPSSGPEDALVYEYRIVVRGRGAAPAMP